MKRYIQQFGKERTGTNYLKALLARNFTDIVLFDNRLGSKHKAFQPVEAWMREHGIEDKIAFDSLLLADPYWRQRNIPSSDLFEWVHQPVTWEELVGLSGGTIPLHYLISIKDPYAFGLSVGRWFRDGTNNLTQPPDGGSVSVQVIDRECRGYNAVYASYLPLLQRPGTLLIRYEDLLTDALTIVRHIATRFDLTARRAEFEDVTQTVAPSAGISESTFYKSFYLEKQYMRVLPDDVLEVITQAIDWDLMERYGYLPAR